MAEQRQASVLRRKTRAAREGADPRVVSPARALRLALARAADTLHDLALVVATVEQRRVPADEVEPALGGDGLFLLLDGAGGARAAMRLCPGFVSALIEVQTTGRVRPGEPRLRPPTRTDAAMVAPLVDALFAGFDDGMGETGDSYPPRGFHFGDRVEDARALSLLLLAPEFDFFRLTVDLGPGLRTGRLDLLLPPASDPSARAADPAAGRARGGTGPREPEDVAAVVLAAPVALDAVLARIRLPLHAAMALAVGQRLEMAKGSLGRVRLMGPDGHVTAEGRLGRCDGWRALRLSAPGAQARAGDGKDHVAPRTAPPPDTTGGPGQAPGPPPNEAGPPQTVATGPESAGPAAPRATGLPADGPEPGDGLLPTGAALAPASA